MNNIGITYYADCINGSDSNSGTNKESAFKTIQGAANIMQAGDKCFIMPGVYEENIRPVNNGTAEKPIIYTADPNAKAVISGGKKLNTKWEVYKGNIYKTKVNMPYGSKNAVFINNEMMRPARWPNADKWLEPSKAISGEGSDSTHIHDENMPKIDWTGAKVWIYSRWYGWTSTITSCDSNGTITFKDGAPDDGYCKCKPGCHYYIYNCLEALDCEKEWYYDEEKQELYLYAPNAANPNDLDVYIKERETAFTLENKEHIVFENLIISVCSIKNTYETKCNFCSFKNCEFIDYDYDADNDGAYKCDNQNNVGIIFYGDNTKFENCEISGSSGYGLLLTGDNSKIYNCCIHDVGYSGTFAEGLHVRGKKYHVSHNTVYNTGSCLIGGNEMQESIVEYNDFFDSGVISIDNGMMHFCGQDYRNSEVRYNWFHRGHDGAALIYLDNMSSNLLIHHNTVFDVLEGDAVRFNIPCNYVVFNDNQVDSHVIMNDYAWAFDEDCYKLQVMNNVFAGGVPEFKESAEVYNNLHSKSDFKKISTGNPGCNLINPPNIANFAYTFPKERNYLYNGGFENFNGKENIPDLTAWKQTGDGNAEGQMDFSTAIGNEKRLTRTGACSIKLTGNSPCFEQTVNGLEPCAEYVFAGWLKISDNAAGAIGVKEYGDENITQSCNATNEYWKHLKLSFKTGAKNTSATVFFAKTSQNGFLYGDDFGLTINKK